MQQVTRHHRFDISLDANFLFDATILLDVTTFPRGIAGLVISSFVKLCSLSSDLLSAADVVIIGQPHGAQRFNLKDWFGVMLQKKDKSSATEFLLRVFSSGLSNS